MSGNQSVNKRRIKITPIKVIYQSTVSVSPSFLLFSLSPTSAPS